jgi:negative regulator of sigma E activity
MNPRDQHDERNHPAGDLREQLSALIDGALPAEQARFLLRRLQHDEVLSGLWERWQLAGDVLRGGAPVALPAGFPSRVAVSIRGEQPRPSAGRRWNRHGLVAALAASVAAVALFVARPVGDGDRPTTGADAAIAVLPAVDVPVSSAAPAVPDVATVPQVAAPVRVADVAARPDRTRTPAIPEAPPVQGVAATDLRVAGGTADDPTASPGGGSGLSPFGAPTAAEDRPWPRAVLPGVSGGELFTAGYATDAAEAGEPRPFAPTRMPVDATGADRERDAP